MCLSKAYINWNDKRELLMEEVASIKIEDGRLLLRTLFGEQKEIEANIREIDFLGHNIYLENLKEKGVSSKEK